MAPAQTPGRRAPARTTVRRATKKPSQTIRSTKTARKAGKRAARRSKQPLRQPTVAERLRQLNLESWEVARDAGKLMGAPAPVRRGFLRTDAEGYEPLRHRERTPLAAMATGGQGGEVRLKLFLTLIWLAARPPHQVRDKTAGAYAHLFGLQEPETNGAKRVGAAIDWLVANDFVIADRKNGRPAKLTLRHERRTDVYTRPKPDGDGKVAEEDIWVNVPAELWSQGWMAVLSGTALTTLLILLDESLGRPEAKGEERTGRGGTTYTHITKSGWVWIAESVLESRYRVSYDFWGKGLKELSAHGLIGRRFDTQLRFGPKYRARRVTILWDNLRDGPPKPT